MEGEDETGGPTNRRDGHKIQTIQIKQGKKQKQKKDRKIKRCNKILCWCPCLIKKNIVAQEKYSNFQNNNETIQQQHYHPNLHQGYSFWFHFFSFVLFIHFVGIVIEEKLCPAATQRQGK